MNEKVLALGRLPVGVMNKTEAAFAKELDLQLKAGLISAWEFEVETFKLADNCRYTPDFRVLEKDRTITFYEVKGFWTDDARVKIKVAAKQNPMYRFIAVKKRAKKDGGGWEREEFLPMEFLGDPQEEKLRTMQEFLRLWAWSQKERRRTGVNPLYWLMASVRNHEAELTRIEQKVADKNNPNAARRGLTLGKSIPMTRIEKQLIARKVGAIMCDPELWCGHYRDKEVLASYYLDQSANWRGCNEMGRAFCRQFKVRKKEANEMLRKALIYFSILYGE